MISPKKLIKLARKSQNMLALRRRRITFPRSSRDIDAESCSTSSLTKKGHFVVYSADQRRFVLPLEYLKNQIVKELFQLAEEEWGLRGNGLLTLPCDAVFMEYLIALIKRHATEDVQGALLMSMTSTRCSSCSYHHQEAKSQQLPISSF